MKKEIKPLNFNEAKEKALRYLELRSHSEKELCDKLRRFDTSREICDEVLEFLREYKLIDDADFAKRYAKDLQNLKHFGKKRIVTELKTKGISNDFIEAAISGLDDTDHVLLSNMIEKKLKGNYDKKNVDKVMRYFINKGYTYNEIKASAENVIMQNVIKGD